MLIDSRAAMMEMTHLCQDKQTEAMLCSFREAFRCFDTTKVGRIPLRVGLNLKLFFLIFDKIPHFNHRIFSQLSDEWVSTQLRYTKGSEY